MSAQEGRTRPPKLPERFLRWVVGSTPDALSIIGDAREEFQARGRMARLGPTLWYWTYVIRFTVAFWAGGSARASSSGGTNDPRVGFNGLVLDLRRSARVLFRRPWLSGAVVTTLALGIGTTTLAYALVDGVLLRPLPFPASEELVDVSRVDPEWYGPNPTAAQAGNVFATPAATFFDWERAATSFSSLGAYAGTVRTFMGDDRPERIVGAVATAGLFETLAVPAAHGRHLVASDDAMGAPPVVVLSHGLWSRRYGFDTRILGRSIRVDGVPTEVVGVMPPGFVFPRESTEFWRSFDDDSRSEPMRMGGYLHALGRLAPGVSLERAQGEIAAVQARLGEDYAAEADFIAVAFSRHELVVARVRPGLLLLLGAAAIVLLVGCANVANLLLTRATERRRELALHAALGASRGRLARLLIGESVLLSLLGGSVGIVLATAALRPFVAAFPMALPRTTSIQIDMRVLVASLLVSVGTGLLLGLLPVLRARRMDLEQILRDGGNKSTGGRHQSRSHALLVVCEVALSVLLLSTAGVFVQSYLNEAGQERGFTQEDIYTFRVSIPTEGRGSAEEVRTFFTRLARESGSIPGVLSVAMAHQMPYSGCCSSPPASVATNEGIEEGIIHTASVTPSYFETMGIPILAGRSLLSTDRAEGPPVVVVSEAMARRYWPAEDPIGKQVRLDTDEDPVWQEVVGVAGNVRYGFGSAESVEFYRAFEQSPYSSQAVILRTAPGVAGVAAAAERAVHDLEPDLPVTFNALVDLVASDRGYRSARVGAIILLVLATVATGLAILGVYSVLAFAVVRRTREIGIRVSLGGSTFGILRDVLGGGLAMTTLGIVVGLALSVGAAATLRSALTGVGTVNAWVLLGVVATMLLTSMIACLLPAWRATRIDPVVAFREE